MSKYFIFAAGVVQGPFQLDQMAVMLSEGKIDMSTPVSTGKHAPWQTVADRSEIIEEKNYQASKQEDSAAEKKISFRRQNDFLLSKLPPEI